VNDPKLVRILQSLGFDDLGREPRLERRPA